MTHMQESEVKDLGTTLAAKVRRAAMMEKHKLESEKFRNQMEKEISQTMEELRRQNDIRRMMALQEQVRTERHPACVQQNDVCGTVALGVEHTMYACTYLRLTQSV